MTFDKIQALFVMFAIWVDQERRLSKVIPRYKCFCTTDKMDQHWEWLALMGFCDVHLITANFLGLNLICQITAH